MGIAELLKPDWKKIALAALLFLLFVPFLTYDNGIRCIRAPCPASSAGSALMFGLSNEHHIYSVDYAVMAAGIVAAYLISCIAISMLRKKKD
ncbi:Uncharacterised protein [uncultured archaeon]|nr:Uncharacterised protein [uncultured archaeon]